MPILDADVAVKEVQGLKTGPPRLKLAPALALVAGGLAIGLMFLLAPKQAKKTVRQVVQAAQSLVKKSPEPKASKDEEESDSAPSSGRHRVRHSARPGNGLSGHTTVATVRRPRPPRPHAEPAGPPPRPSLHDSELPVGTVRSQVKEMFGDPDLELYKLEKEHEVEHLVYVNRAMNYATSILLVDGRVASVYDGMPSVWSWP